MPITLSENFRAVFYAPFYATSELRHYRDEGLDVRLVTSPAPGSGDGWSPRRQHRCHLGGPMRVMKARDEPADRRSCASARLRARTRSTLSAGPGRRVQLADLAELRFASVPRCRRRGSACSTTCARRASIRAASTASLIAAWRRTSTPCRAARSTWRRCSSRSPPPPSARAPARSCTRPAAAA